MHRKLRIHRTPRSTPSSTGTRGPPRQGPNSPSPGQRRGVGELSSRAGCDAGQRRARQARRAGSRPTASAFIGRRGERASRARGRPIARGRTRGADWSARERCEQRPQVARLDWASRNRRGWGYGARMPSSAQAALVFLAIVLPGFLAQGGYRLGRAVPEHPQGLVAVARVIALSTLIALVAWKLGGRSLYDHARAGTALTTHERDTYWFAVSLFVVPGVLGYATGQIVDATARRVADALEALQPPPGPEDPRESAARRVRRSALTTLSSRLLHEGPTTWDRTWRRLRRTEPFAYARISTKGGREIIGLVADRSRVALSPQPRDVFLEQVLRPADDGRYYPTAHGLGVFVAGAEIESVEWVSHEGLIETPSANG
jgi:hypothetical protein